MASPVAVKLSKTAGSNGTDNAESDDSETDSTLGDLSDAAADVTPANLIRELRMQIGLGAPIVLGCLLWYSAGLVAMMFVGRIDGDGDDGSGTGSESDSSASTQSQQLISAVAVANMFSNVTGFSIGMGLTSGIDTIGGQAFGAKNYPLVSRVLQRTLVVITLCCIPIAVLWWNCEPILIWIGQPPAIAHLSARYARILIPALWPGLVCNAVSEWLESQSIMSADVYVGSVMTGVNAFVCWLLIHVYDLGIDGAAIALVAAEWCALLALVLLILFNGWHTQTWRAWDRHHSFTDLTPLLSLAVPGMLMVAAEWWAFEMMLVFAGWLPDATLSVSVMALITQLGGCSYMLHLGATEAANTRVSQLLGAGKPRHARFASNVALGWTSVMSVVFMIGIWFGRMSIGRMFTADPTIVEALGGTLAVFAFTLPLDALQGTAIGILRGMGAQTTGVIINCVGYYGVGTTTALYLAFRYYAHGGAGAEPLTATDATRNGLFGLMTGWLLGLLSVVLLCAFVLSRVDWDVEVQHAAKRVAEEREDEHSYLLAAKNANAVAVSNV